MNIPINKETNVKNLPALSSLRQSLSTALAECIDRTFMFLMNTFIPLCLVSVKVEGFVFITYSPTPSISMAWIFVNAFSL